MRAPASGARPPSPRLGLIVALAGALAGPACKPVSARAAPGFVELSDDANYDFRAVAPEGVAVAARAVKLADKDPTDVAFWERSVALRMRELDGYALLGTKDAAGADGVTGRELTFGHDEDGKPYVYRIRVFVVRGRLLVLEAGGAREQMERMAGAVEWMLGQVRVR
jgi:hypothetical protein